MDYSGFNEFPFPSNLSARDEELRAYFLSLSDDEQLRLLGGSRSYEEFHERAEQYRRVMELMKP